MKQSPRQPITCVFLDIGGVLLTKGWGHASRGRAVTYFELEPTEFEGRHKLFFTAHEEGRLTLDEYLDWVVFHQARWFTHEQFRAFMFAQSQPHREMIRLVAHLKAQHGLKVVALSNEARDLNDHRIRTFDLSQVIDFFISSCFVRMRKPDAAMVRLALDIAQVPAEQIVFIDDTAMFVRVAERMGIHGVVHTDAAATAVALHALGLGTGALPEDAGATPHDRTT